MTKVQKESKVDQLHNLEDQAFFALTQILSVYLKKYEFPSQEMFREKGMSGSFWSLGGIMEAQEKSGVSGEILSLLEHPVPMALKYAMHEIGEALYKYEGSTAMMGRVLERCEDAFPDQAGRVAGILDHAFDGIGGWVA